MRSTFDTVWQTGPDVSQWSVAASPARRLPSRAASWTYQYAHRAWPGLMAGALGGFIAERMARLQREHGVDLRLRTTVDALDSDERGRLRLAHPLDGNVVDAEVAVVSLGAVRNTEWLGMRAGRGVLRGCLRRRLSRPG